MFLSSFIRLLIWHFVGGAKSLSLSDLLTIGRRRQLGFLVQSLWRHAVSPWPSKVPLPVMASRSMFIKTTQWSPPTGPAGAFMIPRRLNSIGPLQGPLNTADFTRNVPFGISIALFPLYWQALANASWKAWKQWQIQKWAPHQRKKFWGKCCSFYSCCIIISPWCCQLVHFQQHRTLLCQTPFRPAGLEQPHWLATERVRWSSTRKASSTSLYRSGLLFPEYSFSSDPVWTLPSGLTQEGVNSPY